MRSKASPSLRLFYEVYRDREAHAEHERQPHTATFLTAVRALVSQIRVEYLSPTAARDLNRHRRLGGRRRRQRDLSDRGSGRQLEQ